MSERFYKMLFRTGDLIKSFLEILLRLCRISSVLAFAVFFVTFLYYIGFTTTIESVLRLRSTFRILFLILFFSKFLTELIHYRKKTGLSLIFEIMVLLFSLGVYLSNFSNLDITSSLWDFFFGNTQIIIAVFLIAISEVSVIAKIISLIKMPPALLFATSFFLIILLGSGLLLLPKAHTIQLSFTDALFTSVSAVCVTGLIVIDTATAFTPLGKIIILCLIQVGGLGIMTFTGFFSFIFAASSSFRDRLLLKEIFSSQSLENLFKLLTKIILWTFLTEIAGALIIYSTLDPASSNKAFFSVFHSISAFCNAGFSTLTDGLFSAGIRNNYPIQITVSLLIILGGIGFPVLLKVYSFFKELFVALLRRVQTRNVPVIRSQMDIPGRIVIFMTLLLIIGGTGLYYLLESKTSLNGLGYTQKLITSFFGSVSSRTAGFNITDITQWGYPTIFLMIFLMWIGASPGSTGGGIKTTTFAIAFRSAYNSIKGREQLIIGNREIGPGTIIRVLAIIFLSIVIICTGFFCLLLSEPDKNPVHLLFECVSAFSTVGLSLAGTSSFSETGKIVVMLMMFIGRVGPLTLFTGLIVSYRKSYSRFPEIDININ